MGIWSRLTGLGRRNLVADAGPVPTGGQPTPGTVANDGLMNLVSGLGTSRDKNYYSTYGIVLPQNQQSLDAAYEGSWLAAKIVDVPAGDMTREWIRTNWDGYDDSGAEDIETAEGQFNLRELVKETVTWARLYGGAVMIPVFKNDAMKWDQPLELDKIQRDSLEGFLVFDRYDLSTDTVFDPRREIINAELPTMYTIQASQTRVHYSRVIRFGGRRLPRRAWLNNGRWDASVLHGGVLDAVSRYDASRMGASSMMSEAVIDVIKVKGLYAALGANGGEAKVMSRFQSAMLIKGNTRSLVLDSEDEYEQKTMGFTGVTDIMGKAELDVAGAAEIPITKLFGDSPGGLNSTGKGEERNYYDKIKVDQEGRLRKPLDMIYQIVLRSQLGEMPENFSFTFNPLWMPSDQETATVEKIRADRDAVYVELGAITPSGVARELLDIGTYRTQEEEDVDAVELDEEEADESAGPLPGAEGETETVPPDTEEPNELDLARQKRARGEDSLPGDSIKLESDGWHAYAGDKHVGGPYKRHRIALRRLQKFDRSYRK